MFKMRPRARSPNQLQCANSKVSFCPTEPRLILNSPQDWRLAYVLPNLQLESAFEFDGIAFVSNNDERLAAVRKSNAAARSLLDGFRDTGGTRLKPAAAIYRFPSAIPTLWEAIADARNCLALACILNGWKTSIGELNNFLIRYSDYFDFYRRWPSENGNDFCYQGPSLEIRMRVPSNFTAQPYAYILPSQKMFDRPEPDERILGALRTVWRRVHILQKVQPADYRQLRSLSVAYEACRVPQAMDNPLYDHGKHCSFWVAAIEALAYRPRKGSGLTQVLDLLERREIRDCRVRRRRLTLINKWATKKTKRFRLLNLVQRLYKRLYDSRNAFLHGNKLPIKLFVPPGLKQGVRLLDVAPLLYLTALEAELIPQQPVVATPLKKLSAAKLRTVIKSCLSRDNTLEDAYRRATDS